MRRPYSQDIGHRAANVPIKLAILGSTRGTDAQAIIEAIAAKKLNATIEVIISNRSKSGILERARQNGIPDVFIGAKGKSREEYVH